MGIVFWISMCVYSVCWASKSPVGSLPGVPEGSTIGHHSGYLDVSTEGYKLNVFYYFVQHTDPDAPLLVWMNGGPGASSLMGLFTELGPSLVNKRSIQNQSDPTSWTLFPNPEAWSHEASLLVWEQPAGVGFSRCIHQSCPQWNDTSSAQANLDTLLAFFKLFPAQQQTDLFISGESYGGIYVPLLSKYVHDHNMHAQQKINMKGLAVGNGCIGYGVTGACGLDQLGLLVDVVEAISPDVSQSTIQAVRSSCEGELEQGLQPRELSAKCRPAMRRWFQELGEYNTYHWGSSCGSSDQGNWGSGDAYTCVGEDTLQTYLSSKEVQRALNVIGDSEEPIEWQAWDGDWPGYNITMADAQPVYRELLSAGYSMLIYNGLLDTAVPALGAMKWLPRVAGQVKQRSKWGLPASHPYGGQIAGHVTSYSSGLRFVTIQGAGHLVPGDRPVPARAMISSFLRGTDLPAYTGLECTPLWLGRGYGDFCA